MSQRWEQAGEQATSSVQAQWPQLIAQVQAELDAGTDPGAPKVQALARRWMELLEFFHLTGIRANRADEPLQAGQRLVAPQAA